MDWFMDAELYGCSNFNSMLRILVLVVLVMGALLLRYRRIQLDDCQCALLIHLPAPPSPRSILVHFVLCSTEA